MVELLFGQRLEEWFRAQNRQRLGLFFLNWERRFALHLQGANGERNCDAPSLQLIPNVGPNGIVSLVDSGVIAHVVFDLVDHGVIGKVDQEHSHRGIGNNVFGALRRTRERFFDEIGWVLVFNANTNPHGVKFRRVMEIDDLVAHHLVVRNVEVNVVIRTQASGTPVDLAHFGVGVAHLQPVPKLVGPVNLNRDAADDSGEQILPSKADDDCDDSRAREQSFQLRFSVIAVAQHKEQYHQENYSTDNLAKKMRNRCLAFLCKIEIPNVPIYQRGDQRRAQQNRRCANVMPPRSMHAIHRDGGIESES